jgi:hypothetical protein
VKDKIMECDTAEWINVSWVSSYVDRHVLRHHVVAAPSYRGSFLSPQYCGEQYRSCDVLVVTA